MASNGEQRQPIELSELVGQLRKELQEAEDAASGERLRFELGPVEVEATVTAGRDAGAGGKVRFYVGEASGNAKFTRSDTQRIKLTLNPKVVAPDGTMRDALIAGDGLHGES
jgi:hypothetical protein